MNTYIKTRGQGIFLMTDSKENMEMAKSEILSEEKHFSSIQAAFNKTGCYLELPWACPTCWDSPPPMGVP
jgi:hypothetical protein